MAEKLFLIDGAALFYRSFYAFIRNPLINSKGEDTSITFGFLNTLVRILSDENPAYFVVVFDTSKPTFRHEMYKEYKANRAEMPEEMRKQLPRLYKSLEDLNFNIVKLDGYEADDIMGTFAKRFANTELDVYIVSGDKDMAQLVNRNTFLYSVGKTGEAPDVLTEEKVLEKFGVKPEQIIDWLALMGDSSDNIPGVPKVGKKTACKFLTDFGSMDGLYENVESLKKSVVKNNLIEFKEDAYLSYKLATIDVDVPIEAELEDLKFKPWDDDVAADLMKELEFNRLAERMRALGKAVKEEVTLTQEYDANTVKYNLIDTEEKLISFATLLGQQKQFIFDLETDSLDTLTANLAGIAISWKANEAWYVVVNHSDVSLEQDLVFAHLAAVFADKNIKKYGQNLKYDLSVLRNKGFAVNGVYFDTMIAAYLLDPANRQQSLDYLADKHLNYRMIPISEVIGSGKEEKVMTELPASECYIYACEDADITLRIAHILEKEIADARLDSLMFGLEIPLMEVLQRVEDNGIGIDADLFSNLSKDISEQLLVSEKKIHDFAGNPFNISSPQQLGQVMFEEKKIHEELGMRKPKKTKTGQISTSEQTLEKFSEHPIINEVLNFRKLAKLKSTYVDALPTMVNAQTGKIHTSYMQTIAATGRLSSVNPNLQNIPIRTDLGKELRRGFIAKNAGYSLLSIDYSQIELRIMAHLSKDKTLIDGFNEGADIHAITASLIFDIALGEVTSDHRRKAKEINFGIMYGMNKWGLANRLHISAKEAEMFIANYFATYPNIQLFMREAIEQAQQTGFVETMMKRRRYLPEIHSDTRNIREFAERMAINTPIQGSAADLIKKAMIDVDSWMQQSGVDAKMLLQVHDELVFEVENSIIESFTNKAGEIMSAALPLSVPVVVDSGFGANWLEAHG